MHQKLKSDPLEDQNLLDPAFASLDSVSPDTLATRAAQTPVPTATSAAERKEKKRIRVDFLFNLKYLDPVFAMTVASAPRLISLLAQTMLMQMSY
ncbi:hypothetical protein MAM1_1262d11543 [Mucor ambiguus]|uniref:Uncharacterized protein n=1 Tax=Mucor ambiguus TaxID=91626 RepID=A0A0C9N749_9FUNG|nr:hypothetical protein MAM1_1262d11543 [Mucor ambiguus]